jgi:cobalt-zinc-cadmium efflux system outer membrane protein
MSSPPRPSRPFFLCTFAAVATLLIWSGQAPAESAAPLVPDPVSLPRVLHLAEALQIFRERGLDLLIADAAVQSAAADVRIAHALPNPALTLGYGKSFAKRLGDPEADPPTSDSWRFIKDPVLSAGLSDQASITSIIFGKRGLRTNVAQAALGAARLTRVDAQRNLESQVKQQFLMTLIARDTLKFAREVQQASTHMLQLTQTRYNAGAISEADLARILTAKLESDQAVDITFQNYRVAQVGLAFLLGLRSTVPDFEVDEPALLHYAVPPSLGNVSRETLLSNAFENRPDLRAVRFQQQRAEHSISLAKRMRIPDIALSLNYTQQGTVEGQAITPPTVLFGISLPLPLLYQQQGEVQKAEADYRTQSLTYAKLQAQVTSDIESAHAAFVSSEQLVKRMETGGLLASAKRARELVSIQYQKGAASLMEFLDAQRTYIGINVEYLQDLTIYWTAVFKLEQAVGTKLQ